MDFEAEKKSLLQRDQEWARLAFAARDIDRILSFWTDDAVVLAPGLPPIAGKAALREYVEGSFRIPGFKINWTSSAASISPDRKLAYLFGDNTVTMDGPDGQPATIAGRAITIWRKESDGEWRCAVDIWNTGP